MKCMKIRKDMKWEITNGVSHYEAARLSELAEYTAIALFPDLGADTILVYENGVMRQVNRREETIIGKHAPFAGRVGYVS